VAVEANFWGRGEAQGAVKFGCWGREGLQRVGNPVSADFGERRGAPRRYGGEEIHQPHHRFY